MFIGQFGRDALSCALSPFNRRRKAAGDEMKSLHRFCDEQCGRHPGGCDGKGIA